MVEGQRYRQDERKVDRISSLPDDVLVWILCLLSFKEATATSILSRRWRYLHTWTRKLDFDGTGIILKLLSQGRTQKAIDNQRRNFIKWVDGVIAANRSSTLEEFKVFFNLDRPYSRTIDNWLRFALSRRVESLELNLTGKGGLCSNYDKYTFPYVGYVEKFKFMKKLSTNLVCVRGEFVKELVRNCPLLQHLSVTFSKDLLFVEIIEPSPSFKCLEICLCHNLNSLVIRDSHIVNLKVMAGKKLKRIEHVVLENVPLLSELWCWLPEDIHHMFSSVLPQLRVFKLFTILCRPEGPQQADTRKFCCVEMSNVEELVVLVGEGFHRIVPIIDDLIIAAPKLERLVVVAPEYDPETEYYAHERRIPPRATKKMGRARSAGKNIPREYPSLKELEIVGYRDEESQFEVLMYLVKKAGLQSIVVDPRGVYFHLDNWWEFVPQPRIKQDVLETALELINYIPSRINLRVLL